MKVYILYKEYTHEGASAPIGAFDSRQSAMNKGLLEATTEGKSYGYIYGSFRKDPNEDVWESININNDRDMYVIKELELEG